MFASLLKGVLCLSDWTPVQLYVLCYSTIDLSLFVKRYILMFKNYDKIVFYLVMSIWRIQLWK